MWHLIFLLSLFSSNVQGRINWSEYFDASPQEMPTRSTGDCKIVPAREFWKFKKNENNGPPVLMYLLLYQGKPIAEGTILQVYSSMKGLEDHGGCGGTGATNRCRAENKAAMGDLWCSVDWTNTAAQHVIDGEFKVNNTSGIRTVSDVFTFVDTQGGQQSCSCVSLHLDGYVPKEKTEVSRFFERRENALRYNQALYDPANIQNELAAMDNEIALSQSKMSEPKTRIKDRRDPAILRTLREQVKFYSSNPQLRGPRVIEGTR